MYRIILEQHTQPFIAPFSSCFHLMILNETGDADCNTAILRPHSREDTRRIILTMESTQHE